MRLVYEGFAWSRKEDAFLDISQAKWALIELWRRVAGSAKWQGPPSIEFVSMTKEDASVENALLPGKLPWVEIDRILECSIDRTPLKEIDTPSLPRLGFRLVQDDRENVSFPLDLVTATFLQLSRWEEWAHPVLDQFGCHDEKHSLAARQGFIDRPVIDEWAMVLRFRLAKLAPAWKPDLPSSQIDLTHDIDVLRYYDRPSRVFRAFGRKLLKERSGLGAIRGVIEGASALLNSEKDPCVTAFDELMKFAEDRGLASTFFFMAARPGKWDDGYSVEQPLFAKIRNRILAQGHSCGWHPGFGAAADDGILKQEHARLSNVLGTSKFPVRHHFLRWSADRSWRRLAALGCTYDGSVGYNYTNGFRASTAHPYRAWDHETNSPLNIEVRPLIAMDGPLIRDERPLSEVVEMLRRRCDAVRGRFSLCVHNYSLMYYPTLLRDIGLGLGR